MSEGNGFITPELHAVATGNLHAGFSLTEREILVKLLV